MMNVAKLIAVSYLCISGVANAQPGADVDETPTNPIVKNDFRPPSAVPTAAPRIERSQPFATTRPWGGGLRLTGLSGIGALPGVNYGAELAGLVRYNEYFAELGFGWWKPEKTYVVTETPE